MAVLAFRSGKTAEAIQWFRRAVSGGWRNSNVALGSLLEQLGDKQGAAEAFENGAQLGCADSQDALGRLALEEETEESFKAARYWSEKAAAQGNVEAQTRLGTIFHEGLGVARDPEQAAWWFLQAVKQNHAGAQAMLGVATHLGIGIDANRFEAMRLLMLSAAQGNEIAKAYLPTLNAELTPDEKSRIEQWIAAIGAKRTQPN